MLDDGFTLLTNSIRTIEIGFANISFPPLQNQTNLNRVGYQYNRNTSAESSLFIPGSVDNTGYKLLNCANLDTIQVRNSSLSGYIPRFQGNKKLSI